MKKIPGWSGTIAITLERDGDEHDAEAVVEVSDYYPANISGPPERCYPADGGEVDIRSVTLYGVDVTNSLTPQEVSAIETAALQEAEEHADDYDGPDEEYAYSARYGRSGEYEGG